MVSRVDRMATSSISENKELNLAVDTVVAKISQELTWDVPGAAGQEYHDYPDANDIWLVDITTLKREIFLKNLSLGSNDTISNIVASFI